MPSPRPLLLALDVGNTNVVVGLLPLPTGKPAALFRFPTGAARSGKGWSTLVGQAFASTGIPRELLRGAILGSVVPAADRGLLLAAKELLGGGEPIRFDPARQRLIRLRVRSAARIGADRVLDALAAREIFGPPCVVVDIGTATTVDAVSPSGELLGGAIAPGPLLAAEALSQGTARLPAIPLRPPSHPIGRDTVPAIESGIWHGQVGLVETLVRRYADEMGVRKPKVIATGGLAPLFAREPGLFTVVDPFLTLEGLRIAWLRGNGGEWAP
jgi:type III pantothenate kinase